MTYERRDEKDPTIRQAGTIPVITMIPAWTWRCEECGWLGVGLSSEFAALKEASNHYWDEHNLALCKNLDDPAQFAAHVGHRFHLVKGTDSTEQCERCGVFFGK